MIKFLFIIAASISLIISCSDNGPESSNSPDLFNFDLIPHYTDVDHWLPENGTSNDLLLSKNAQDKHYQRFLEKWYAPWQMSAMQKEFTQDIFYDMVASDIVKFQQEIELSVQCAQSNNCLPIALKTNYHHYTPAWLTPIADNMHIERFKNLSYQVQQRAIVTTNSLVRFLPTNDVYYRRFAKTGNVLPFDRLQTSAIWAGTPIYILGATHDKAWLYIYTSSYTGWLPADTVGLVDQTFIDTWESKPLMAIMKNNVSIIDNQSQHYLAQLGIGSVLPGTFKSDKEIEVQFPIRNTNGHAQITTTTLNNESRPTILPMPAPANSKNFSFVLTDMVDKPYGWGGEHFYNDCSQELKNIYTPFGIWLDRHSQSQVKNVKLDNLDDVKDEKARIDFIKEHAHPMMTIAYIGGHSMMYIGEDGNGIPTFYQNIWMMREKNTAKMQVIGQSLFLPVSIQGDSHHSLVDPTIRDHLWLGHLDQPS
jgi:hypothetical protein